ncbi:hypothetical protein SUGI_0647160 [Cryptomeria japonica]|nr:hypothetical protein SUGI_0647160 [Cryptomeria japonica]
MQTSSSCSETGRRFCSLDCKILRNVTIFCGRYAYSIMLLAAIIIQIYNSMDITLDGKMRVTVVSVLPACADMGDLQLGYTQRYGTHGQVMQDDSRLGDAQSSSRSVSKIMLSYHSGEQIV